MEKKEQHRRMAQREQRLRRMALGLAMLTALNMSAGCQDKRAEKIRNLEKENKLLREYKKNVETADDIAIDIGMSETKLNRGCKQDGSAGLIRRTNLACAWVNYAAGLMIHKENEKKLQRDNPEKEMTADEIAQWSLVMELSNRYVEVEDERPELSYGKARFMMLRASILDSQFRQRVKPRDALRYIRNYMFMSQKDYGDVLARTSAGEKTTLTAENDSKKKSSGNDTPKKSDEVPVAKEAKGDRKDEKSPGTTAKRKWTYAEAMKEACDAGRQYREDVDLHGMKPSQARYEAQEYSKYLAENSPAPQKALYDKINQGLWMDSCF